MLHDVGFALTLGLLLLGPEVPIGEWGSASLGVFGFAVWLVLSSRLPLMRFLRMKSVLGLLAFVLYLLLVSCLNARPGAILYALHLAVYAFAAAMLFPAYLADDERRARAFRILAWIGAIYCAGTLVSLWTGGAIYEITGMRTKHYEGFSMVRGVGFASSANLAGGVAAIFAAFLLLLHRPRGRLPILFALLALAGLFASLSRGAMLGLVVGLTAVATVAGVRSILLGGALVVQARGVALLLLIGTAITVSPMAVAHIDAVAQRLVLDSAKRSQDVGLRVEAWTDGVQAWWSSSSVMEQVVGAGMKSEGRSNRGVYEGSHSTYVTILRDAGVIGLLMFVAVTLSAMVRFAGALMRGPNRLAAFALAGLATITVENILHIFTYSESIIVLLLLLLTCGEMACSQARLYAASAGKADLILQRRGV